MLPQKFSFVDVETTGTNPRFDRIIEIGVLLVEQNEIVSTFSSLVNPHTHLPPEITRITGITTEDLIDAPSFEDIRRNLTDLLADTVFVAHNARFDYGFLKYEYARMHEAFSFKQFCTLRMARLLFPKLPRHNLDTLIAHFQLPCEKRHRALDDATAMYHFFKKAEEQTDPESFSKTITTVLKRVRLPLHIQKESIDSLPDSPGVYIMYGQSDLPLYIGKSKNIRERIISHFTSDLRSATEMKISQQIRRIETKQTAGELGALFLESALIKKMLPLYNKRLRNSRKMTLLKKEEGSDGYMRIYRQPFVNGDVLDDLQSIVGICKSDKEAKNFLYTVAKEHTLCPKLLSLEKSTTSCFYYRLGYCNGACIKKEQAMRYNLRHIVAFSKSKITPWPFPGSIAIVENGFDGRSEHLLVDNWCYTGNIIEDTDGNRSENRVTNGFDVDTYKILRSFLLRKQNGARIMTLPPDESGKNAGQNAFY